ANQDYEGFYKEEISYRDLMVYPPVAHMMAVLVLADDELTGAGHAGELAEQAKRQFHDRNPVIIGPTEAYIGKINDVYRYIFYVKHRDYQVLTEIKDALEQTIHRMQWNVDSVQFDFNPMSSY
ncbi:MAG: primosomal protein N', partial [Lachnospiraceae bacterium]|nr:primosomal protein N' [Lachnospiraceae bacterium]